MTEFQVDLFSGEFGNEGSVVGVDWGGEFDFEEISEKGRVFRSVDGAVAEIEKRGLVGRACVVEGFYVNPNTAQESFGFGVRKFGFDEGFIDSVMQDGVSIRSSHLFHSDEGILGLRLIGRELGGFNVWIDTLTSVIYKCIEKHTRFFHIRPGKRYMDLARQDVLRSIKCGDFPILKSGEKYIEGLNILRKMDLKPIYKETN